MKITEVKVYPAKANGSGKKLKAYATIVFEDSFIVRDLKIIEGNKGLFVSMPSRRLKDGRFKDVAHPVKPEMREMIEQSVIQEYNKLLLV